MGLTNGRTAVLDASGTPDAIKRDILTMGHILSKMDSAAYAEAVMTLAEGLSFEQRRRLSDSLISPYDAIGIMRDSPVWDEVEAAIERNRQNDTGD